MISIMSAPVPRQTNDLPAGFEGMRAAVLVALKHGRLTARDLSARLGVSLNGIRHHLKDLELEGFVAYERVARGVGAPVFLYVLTPAGEARFPRRYKEALEQLLEYVEARDGRAGVVAALELRFDVLAERLRPELEGAEAVERMQAVVRALSDEGYMAEGRATFCCGTLVEHNCAMREVAERFPEICAAEARFLESMLGGTVERRAHMLGGCNACEYTVQFPQETA